jgi:hypothetical protein
MRAERKFRSTPTIIAQFTAATMNAGYAGERRCFSAKSLHYVVTEVAIDWIADCRKMIELSIEVSQTSSGSAAQVPTSWALMARTCTYVYTKMYN